jgi:hypothetical protein
MSGFLQDGQGNTSHKRIINIMAGVCAVILTIGAPAYIILQKSPDIGTNMVALILGIWGIAAGGAVLSNIVEKK